MKQVIEFNGRFALAQWDARNLNWIADMTREAKRLTGCSQVSARTEKGIITDSCVQRYTRQALRKHITTTSDDSPRDLRAAGFRVPA